MKLRVPAVPEVLLCSSYSEYYLSQSELLVKGQFVPDRDKTQSEWTRVDRRSKE